MTIRDISNFLSLEFKSAMMDFYRSSRKYIGDHHSKLIFAPIDNSNSNKWKNDLTKKEVCIYQKVAGCVLKKYKYEISDEKTCSYYDLIKKLCVGIPLKLYEMVRIRCRLYVAMKKGSEMKGIVVGDMPKEK